MTKPIIENGIMVKPGKLNDRYGQIIYRYMLIGDEWEYGDFTYYGEFIETDFVIQKAHIPSEIYSIWFTSYISMEEFKMNLMLGMYTDE